MECRVCSQPISIDEAVSLFSSVNTNGDNVVKTIIDVMREFASVTVLLHNDRSKHICSSCLTTLVSGFHLQQLIRANEIATFTTNAEVSNVLEHEESEYQFECLDEFKDEIAGGPGDAEKPTAFDAIPEDSHVQVEDEEAPGKQLTPQLTEEEMDYLTEGLQEQPKFAFEMPPKELIAQQLTFDKFEYLEISGERCCGCAHIAPSRDALMVHAKEMHSQNYYADSSYTCPTCYEKFPTEDSLAKHTQDFSFSDIFLCCVCQEAFNFRSHIMNHLMQEHGHQDGDEYEFETPKRKSTRKGIEERLELPDSKIIRETLEFSQYRQYLVHGERCCACGLYMESIQSHVAEEHSSEDSGDPLQCTICQRSFASHRLLMLHEGERINKLSHLYECRTCNEVFAKKYHLMKHLQKELHTSSEKGDTQIPERTETAASDPQLPLMPSPKDVDCFCCCFRRCKVEFATEAELLHHANQCHAGRRKENETKNGEPDDFSEKHVCPICLLLFETAEKLRQHRFYKMYVDNQRCHLCGRTFMRKSGLREHQEREHLDLPPRFACETCGKHFITRSTLTHHQRVHGPFKSCPCDAKDCGLVFRDEHLMRRHYRNVHAENKPYACRHCQKVFRTKESLDIHERYHTGERPFACRHEGCNNRYAHGTDRLRHERSAHTGERPHRCSVCNARFFRRRELRMHIEKLHTY